MFRLCLKSLGSGSWSSVLVLLPTALCLINFLSYLILSSFSFNSLSFSFRTRSFFSSSVRLY